MCGMYFVSFSLSFSNSSYLIRKEQCGAHFYARCWRHLLQSCRLGWCWGHLGQSSCEAGFEGIKVLFLLGFQYRFLHRGIRSLCIEFCVVVIFPECHITYSSILWCCLNIHNLKMKEMMILLWDIARSSQQLKQSLNAKQHLTIWLCTPDWWRGTMPYNFIILVDTIIGTI
jgi:hypothetical protein